MKNPNKYLTYPQAIDKILQDMELVFKTEKQPIGVMLGTNKPKFKNWAIPVLNQMLLLDDKDTNSILQDFKSELRGKK